ncbi:MAG TPA: DUF6448 family protein [Candidatus Ozemobacteraceae bacterium]|nr:DUF6448 family protein [Candidatus Ozemobacteraceae bacterium]
MHFTIRSSLFVLTLASVFALLSPAMLSAHCDTFDGPVLKEAKQALVTGDATPLLKWVRAQDEKAITTAFDKARRSGLADRERAEQAFFETFVRIHRESEGAPFTGVKPAGTDLPAAIRAADEALESGSSRDLVELLTKDLVKNLQVKYRDALEKKRKAGTSVAAGREYVEAYVTYVHYVEALDAALNAKKAHGAEGSPAAGGCSSCESHDH